MNGDQEEIVAMLEGAHDDDEGDSSTSAPATNAPSDGEYETDAPETGAPETEAPAGDDDEVTQLRAELAAMREAFAQVMDKAKTPTTSAPAEPEISEVDFMSGIEMEDLQDDPKVFNSILNRVLKEGVRMGRESVLRDIPNIVTHNVRQQSVLKEATDNFYKNNEDLIPFKRVVGAVAEEILSDNPEITLEELFKKAGADTRKRLALVRQAQGREPERRPGLPRKQRGARKPAAGLQLTSEEQEIADMIKGV